MSPSSFEQPASQGQSHLLNKKTVFLLGSCVCLLAVFNHYWLGNANTRGHYPTKGWPWVEILLTLMAEGLLLIMLIAFCEKWYRGDRRSMAQFRLSGLLCVATIIALGFGGWRATQARQARIDKEAVAETVRRTIQGGTTNGGRTLSLGNKVLSHEVWQVLEEGRDFTCLDLSETNLGDRELPFLSGHTELTNLVLAGSQITDKGLAHVAAIPSLKQLDLSRTHVSDDGLVHLARLQRLESLNLSNTGATGAGFVHLVDLANLKTLSLIGNSMSPAGLDHLANMPQLRGLDLLSTDISDSDLSLLRTLPDLERLFLQNTRVTDTGLQHLEGLANLKRLGLSNTRITDAGLASLAKMPALEYLELSNTSITDDGLVHLKDLAELRFLILHCPAITGVGLNHLEGLQKLEFINFGGPQITNGVSGTWTLPPNLERLHLHLTSMTEARIEGLREAHPDIRITCYP